MNTCWLGLLVYGAISGLWSPLPVQAGDTPVGKKVEDARAHRKQRSLPAARSRREGKRKASKVTRRKAGRIQNLSLPDELGRIARAVSTRRYRSVLYLARQALEKDALNDDAHAAMVVGCGHFGDYPCVDQSYEEAETSDSLVLMREVAKADSLRHQGQPEAAAELRRQIVVDHSKANREMSLLSMLALDHEAAGDWESAYDVAWEAVALDPDSQIGWAMVARAEAATAGVEAAESYLWLADRIGTVSVTVPTARADIHRMYGDELYASTLFESTKANAVPSIRYTVARTRALLAVDLPLEVIDLYEVCGWCMDAEVWHPDLQATFGVALAQVGRLDEALVYADRLERTYPSHPPAVEAAARIRALVP